MTINLAVLEVVKIHQHAKFQAISSMGCPGNAWKPQIWPQIAWTPKRHPISHLCGMFFVVNFQRYFKKNKANLRDLIAATGLVILLKLDLNLRFFSPCDLEIWRMTQKNNRAPLLCYFKLFASFCSHWRIQTGVRVRKSLIWVNIDAFFSLVTLKFDGWPSKTIGHLFYATSSFVQHFVAIGEFKLELQSGNAQSGSNSMLFRAVWPWNLTDDLEKQ